MRGMKGLGSEKSWPTLGVGGVPNQCGLEGVLVSVRRRVLGNCGSASENVTAKLATCRAEEANALLRTCYSLGTTRREIGLNLGVTIACSTVVTSSRQLQEFKSPRWSKTAHGVQPRGSKPYSGVRSLRNHAVMRRYM